MALRPAERTAFRPASDLKQRETRLIDLAGRAEPGEYDGLTRNGRPVRQFQRRGYIVEPICNFASTIVKNLVANRPKYGERRLSRSISLNSASTQDWRDGELSGRSRT